MRPINPNLFPRISCCFAQILPDEITIILINVFPFHFYFLAPDVDDCRQNCAAMASCVSAYIDATDMKCYLSNAYPVPLMYRRHDSPALDHGSERHAYIWVFRANSHGVYQDQDYATCQNESPAEIAYDKVAEAAFEQEEAEKLEKVMMKSSSKAMEAAKSSNKSSKKSNSK